MEQDIADLTAQSCNHRFSEDFHESIRQMQEKSSDKHAAKISRPLWRFLPAAAMIALVCLAGFRLLDLAPFRMGSPGPGYGKGAEEAAGQDARPDRKEVGDSGMASTTKKTGEPCRNRLKAKPIHRQTIPRPEKKTGRGMKILLKTGLLSEP